MSHVFISYSHDDQDKAFALDGRLRTASIKTFIDDATLRAGIEWRSTLQVALDGAFAVIVVCTKSSMSSHEVSFEWAYAMGQGTPVVPLVYEQDCQLHSHLQMLQYLDFSDVRNRPWDELISVLAQDRDQPRPTVGFLRKAGIAQIAFARDELSVDYSITRILERVKADTQLLVVARSCEAWARQFLDLQNALNRKSVWVQLAMVDPSVPKGQWMIESDYARLDAETTLGKLRMIKLDSRSEGGLELFYLPSSSLFSFVHFVDQNNDRMGILEAGAGLPLNKRTAMILRSNDTMEGIMLERIHEMYSSVLVSRSPVFVIKPEHRL